jgi:hypothetical protein
MSKPTNIKIVPFDGRGSLLAWTGAELGVDDPVQIRGNYKTMPDRRDLERATYWRPAAPFQATLILDRLERGRSAARFIWKDAAGHEFPMFGQWLCDTIKQAALDKGSLTGTWGYAKRGANYSVAFLHP